MKNKPIIVVAGQPNSIFFEIFLKSIKIKKYKSPIILIASSELLNSQMKKFKSKKKIKLLNLRNLKKEKLNNNMINIIDIKLHDKKSYKNKSNNINNYINQSFELAFKIIKDGYTDKMINGPINKTNFLNKKFLGITEYISYKFKIKKNAMLIYNKDLSVSPVTTHLPIKLVSKKITKKLILEKIILINDSYKKNFGI